jgi:hypothetical protein
MEEILFLFQAYICPKMIPEPQNNSVLFRIVIQSYSDL